MITVLVNGEPRKIPDNLTIATSLDFLELTNRPLLVEHNGIALLKSEWSEKSIVANDRLELVQIVAGG